MGRHYQAVCNSLVIRTFPWFQLLCIVNFFTSYEERIDGVETRIAARLRDLLGTAKSANEMFRYFSRFNALFVRPHIRGAIREYQTQLINRVREDTEALHEKFKNQYRFSRASRLSKLRDIPPVAGSIIWARQIEERLNTYLRRVEDVLGKLLDYCFPHRFFLSLLALITMRNLIN